MKPDSIVLLMKNRQYEMNRRQFARRTGAVIASAACCGLTSAAVRADESEKQADRRGNQRHFEPATERTPAIARYEEFRFGMFIHFTMSGFLDGFFWDTFNGPLPSARKYAPDKLDVDQWIRTAARAEMKYAVLTAHHQLGFALWDSKYTEFDVANSGNTTDVVAEYVKACRKHGVAPGLFYALGMDKAHRRDRKMTEEQWCNHGRNQISELLTNYGPIPILWLDSLTRISPAQLQKTYDTVKSIQPDCLIVGNHNYGANGLRIRHFPVDIIAGERTLPPIDGHDPRMKHGGKTYYIPMETCDTICTGTHSKGWFWQPDERLKEVKLELMQQYRKTVGKDANMLLNVGPNREGRLPVATVQRLLELGAAIRKFEKK